MSAAFKAAASTLQWRRAVVTKLQNVLETHNKARAEEAQLSVMEEEVAKVEEQVMHACCMPLDPREL